ncbi:MULTISPECIES: DUF6542 domain-containing protein [Nocardiopsis]|uniref:DUF6542 domain-containing protein n=1 Tax=Nocardiopsis sinuspersici TaxID=501010 RepID=A0A1V3BVI6_9ACTN|nr:MULTISPECIES: DUF6542 domain-containing protein [Nocardiopsis]OOC52515.1 hypothetical protein NOSIN_00575 [Nocardiopsis sinuspersici]
MPPRETHGPDPGQAPYFVRSHGRGRSRDRSASHAGNRRRAAPGPKAGGAPRRTSRLTGRGGVLAITVFSFAGIMVAHWAGTPTAPGIAFTLACLLGAVLVRPSDLLSLSVSPPIAFFAAVVAAESLFALGSEGFTRTLLLGLASRLAEVAPWLFLGTALVLVIGVFRGLPGNIRDLGDQLNGRR